MGCQLKADLLKEAQLMMQDILTSHRPVSDLLLAEHGFSMSDLRLIMRSLARGSLSGDLSESQWPERI